MDQDRAFYKMEVGGKAEQIVKSFMVEYREIQDAWWNFSKKYGGEGLYTGTQLQKMRLLLSGRNRKFLRMEKVK